METTALTLNDNHRNTLLAGLKYIDHLLAEGVVGLAAADHGAVFSPAVADASPTQRKVITDLAQRLRGTLRSALSAYGIPVRPPTQSALWNLRSALTFIDIALEDLGPDHLRGYGAINDETARGVAALQAEMRTRLTELESYLASGLGGDLSNRFSRLDQTADEVRLLRELERIITAHGLVELRQPLVLLLGRIEKNWWTVAFVGRVSSGKSSLLNYLLATDVLPAGVTPVTAVPIRIVPGAPASATISFATQKPIEIPTTRLGEFASEEHNPGNSLHVSDILLTLPAARLAEGICFVDTPGLGSLATAGAAQTLEFLPRCDLGVFLLDSASTLTDEDIEVIRTLIEGGADVLVVLSKADLLNPTDRAKMLTYVHDQLTAALSRDIPVSSVSVAPGQTELTEVWFSAMLGPRQTKHRELAAAALRRKVGVLKETVMMLLSRRDGAPPRALPEGGPTSNFGAVRARIEANRRKLYDLAFQATPRTDGVWEYVADKIAKESTEADSNSLTVAVAAALNEVAAKLGDQFDDLLRGAREAAEQALNAAGQSPPSEKVSFSESFSRPLFDPAPILATGKLTTGWQHWPAVAVRRAALRRLLAARFDKSLDEALRAFAHALVGWSQHYLDDLAVQFNAQAGLVEAGASGSGEGLSSPERDQDLELLRRWNTAPHNAAPPAVTPT